jgi:cytochrome b subunit of formate dehydrogenase
MKRESEIRRYGKIVIMEHWLNMLIIFGLIITGLFLVRDWFVHEFHIYGAEMYVPTPDFASSIHFWAALAILILGAVHLIAHGPQREKPILPKRSMYELKQAMYSLMFLVFLTKKQERGSGEKYLKSQRIIYAFTIYVIGLAAITGFLNYIDLLGEYMLNSHIVAGVLLILVAVHRMALVIRRHDKVALRSVLSTGTMPMWYVRKNHKVWYEEIMGRGASDTEIPAETKKKKTQPIKGPNMEDEPVNSGIKTAERIQMEKLESMSLDAEDRACIIEDKEKDV